MPIAAFPHHYAVTLTNDQLTADARAAIRMGAPPQFNGSEDVWSPEHLLVAAVLSCVKTTFDAYARREGIVVHGWRGNATGVLAKARPGPVFTSIDIEVEITTDSGAEARAAEVLAAAERDCIISRALSAPVHVTAKVTPSPALAAVTSMQ
jgi:organic hydroperoxide reductase OsmC/OhrA